MMEKRGFTLIQVIAVVALLAIALPFFRPIMKAFQDIWREHKTKKEMREIEEGLLAYKFDIGNFPSSITNLVWDTDPNWQGPYFSGGIEEVKEDEFRKDYVYRVSQETALLLSYGRNLTNDTCLQPDCSDWQPGLGFQTGEDDLGFEVKGERPTFEKLLRTAGKLERIARKLEEYFMWQCIRDDGRTETTNYFPQYVTQVISDGELFDDWDSRIRCNSSPSLSWDECEVLTSSEPFVIALWGAFSLGEPISSPAIGWCPRRPPASWCIASAREFQCSQNLGWEVLGVLIPPSESGFGPYNTIAWGLPPANASPDIQVWRGIGDIRYSGNLKGLLGFQFDCPYSAMTFTCCNAQGGCGIDPMWAGWPKPATLEGGVFTFVPIGTSNLRVMQNKP